MNTDEDESSLLTFIDALQKLLSNFCTNKDCVSLSQGRAHHSVVPKYIEIHHCIVSPIGYERAGCCILT